MHKIRLQQPVLFYAYGLPGSGKTFVSRQLCDTIEAAHISADRLRHELFSEPRYDKNEHRILVGLMNYMTEEFLRAGVSVVYDASVNRLADRRALRDMARKHHAKDLFIWIQIDPETAWGRQKNRDRRKADDRFSDPLTPQQFEAWMRSMQNPQNEDFLVISGKHLFNSQQSAILRRLQDMGVVDNDSLHAKMPKPGLVNLVSRAQAQAGRVDMSRRNIVIR